MELYCKVTIGYNPIGADLDADIRAGPLPAATIGADGGHRIAVHVYVDHAVVSLGFGRIVALHHHSSTSHQNH